jgi:DNA polymerase-3 subunit gamma/tau
VDQVALALYRKYRPRTFTEVIGQEHVTEPLMQALRSGRLHHAYLFSGPRGCGKTSSARILARSLNCEKGPTPEPCGVCESCLALAPEGPGSIDVIEIDAASHGGVDDARDLRERAFFAPVASRFKVYVIDEAHMVSPQGFNALLKLVEEPPDYVTFVFATTEPEKVLGTIKSRTHHYPFRLVPPGVLRPYLELLCREEGVMVEPAVFPLVVRSGGGSVRDSLSVLDQLMAGADASGVTYARAVALLGVTDVALIDEMTDALEAGDGASALATVDRIVEAGHDPRRFASDLLERLRDLIVLQRVPDAVTSGIIDAPVDQLERMSAQAARIGPATLSRLADIVHNGLTEMRGTTAPRLLLELIVARMLLPGAEDSTGALLQRLERMERRLGASAPEPTSASSRAGGASAEAAHGPSAPPDASDDAGTPQAGSPGAAPSSRTSDARTPAPTEKPVSAAPEKPARVARDAPPPGPAGASEPAAIPGSLDVAAVRAVWGEVVTGVRRQSRVVAAYLEGATVRDLDGDTLVLLFQFAAHAQRIREAPGLLIQALHEVFGGSWNIRAELSGDERQRPDSTPRGPVAPEAPAAEPSVSGPSPVDGAGSATPSAPSVSPAADDPDWPTTARLGGASAGSAGESGAEPAPPTSAAPSVSSPQKSGGRRSARTPAPKSNPASKGNQASKGSRNAVPEPVGFDPGDEPLDDAPTGDSSGPRETAEEKVLRDLGQHFQVEKIGE